jgi:hypothetical protein
MEYWNDGLRAMETKILFFSTIPLLHQFILSAFDTHYSNNPSCQLSKGSCSEPPESQEKLETPEEISF